ncbi:DUF742 domain-containing protein [Phytomonospora sp. NPDC050363]|uniref:DUF742 domain-containing protein n=1 Tax=Phytomonospora sp. NPDC050363 TaxID=3155642 RepID=UPI0034068C46
MTPVRRSRAGLVRSHTPTDGQARPVRSSLDESTLLYPDTNIERGGLSMTASRVMDLLAPGVLALAEISAHLRMPVPIVKVIAADLVASGHVLARTPAPPEQRNDCELLERILSALHEL